MTHKTLEKQFNPDEGFVCFIPHHTDKDTQTLYYYSSTSHSAEVKKLIIQGITRQPNCKFPVDIIKGSQSYVVCFPTNLHASVLINIL